MFRKETRWIKLSFSANSLHENQIEIAYIAGMKLCFVSNSNGVFAFEEKCPHNGFSLAGGTITSDGESVVCPLHRYAYNMKTGRCSHGSGGAARIFPVEQREEGLYIGIQETRWGW